MGDVITEYESDSKPGQYHKIVRGKDGVVYCDCWAWRMNKRCKHLDRFFADAGCKSIASKFGEDSVKEMRKQLDEVQASGETWASNGESAEKTGSKAAQVFEAIEQERGSIRMWEK